MIDVTVPDIGDFTDVPVIEILVEVGQEVAEEDPLVTLESDKATMDVPAPQAGVVRELKVALGDKVSEGSPILVLEPAATDGAGPPPAAPEPGEAEAVRGSPAPRDAGISEASAGVEHEAQVVVL